MFYRSQQKDKSQKLESRKESRESRESQKEPESQELSDTEVSVSSETSVIKIRSKEREIYNADTDSETDSETDSNIRKLKEMELSEPELDAGPEYFYLYETNLLEYNFYLSEIPETPIQIHLVLYNISDNIKISTDSSPFLSFVQEKTGEPEMYSFPVFNYSINIPEEESDVHDLFMNACLTHIFKLFRLTIDDTISQRFSDYYKGFLKTSQTDYLVVFDCRFVNENSNMLIRQFVSKTNLDTGYTWSILHELLNEQKIDNIQVHPYVIEQLLKYDFLLYITDKNGIPKDIPFMLYGCERTSAIHGGAIFDFFDSAKPGPETGPQPEKKSLFKNIRKDSKKTLSRIEHPDYGYNYFFSSETLETDCKKYIVFLKNTFYDIIPNKVEQDYSSVYFQESGVPFWMVKSVDFFIEF